MTGELGFGESAAERGVVPEGDLDVVVAAVAGAGHRLDLVALDVEGVEGCFEGEGAADPADERVGVGEGEGGGEVVGVGVGGEAELEHGGGGEGGVLRAAGEGHVERAGAQEARRGASRR